MKRIVSKVVAVALALLFVASMASVAFAVQVLYVNQAVNVRTGPGTNYVTLGWLDKGDSVQATGNAVGGWTQIQYSTYEIGYVKSSYLSSSATSGSSYSYNYSCTPCYAPVLSKVTPRVCEECGAIYKTTSKLNIRSGPGTNYSVIGTLSKGQQVTRVGQDGKWFKILTNEGVNAYASSKYLKAVTVVSTICTTPVYSYEPTRTYNYSCAVSTSKLYSTTALRVRSGPGTNYSIIGSLQRGEGVTYRGTSGSWYQITTCNGLTGYAHSKYLTGSAPAVRYSSTPARSYNNCYTCGDYYYGTTCSSCYGSTNNSSYSTRYCRPVFSTYNNGSSKFGSTVTIREAITMTLAKKVASPSTLTVNVDTLTLPVGTSVFVSDASSTADGYVYSITYTDGADNIWKATGVAASKLN